MLLVLSNTLTCGMKKKKPPVTEKLIRSRNPRQQTAPATAKRTTLYPLFFHCGAVFAAYTRYANSPGSNATDKKWQSTMLTPDQPARNGKRLPAFRYVRSRKSSV